MVSSSLQSSGGFSDGAQGPLILGDRANLDTADPRAGDPRRHLYRLVEAARIYHEVAAELLLGLDPGAVGGRNPAVAHADRGRGRGRYQPVARDEMAALADFLDEDFVVLEVLLRGRRVHLLHDFLGANQAQEFHPDSSLLFGRGPEIGEPGLEVLADHLVHVEEKVNDLGEVGSLALHRPLYAGGVALRLQCEDDVVVRFEGLYEIQLDRDPGRRDRVRDFHAPLADVLVAVPGVGGALAALRAETPLHRGILLLPRRPRAPAVEIVDERKDLVRRRLDAGRALDAEGIRPGRGENQNAGDEKNEDDADGLEHVPSLLLLALLAGVCLLEPRDVELLHLQQFLHHALRLARILVLEHPGELRRDDLPRDAVAVLQPAALLRLGVSALREFVPVVVDLRLGLAEDLEGDGFVELE